MKNKIVIILLFTNTLLFSQTEKLEVIKNLVSELTFNSPISPTSSQIALQDVNSDLFMAIPDLGVKNNQSFYVMCDKNTPLLGKASTIVISFDFDENTNKAKSCSLMYSFSIFDNSYLELLYESIVSKLKENSYSFVIYENSLTTLHNPMRFYSSSSMDPRKVKSGKNRFYANTYIVQNKYSSGYYNVLNVIFYYDKIR